MIGQIQLRPRSPSSKSLRFGVSSLHIWRGDETETGYSKVD
ncbi:hypothetical protein P0O24_12395 [Methanotrichaceae archaeon M04Ac]|uniref:Uncharacterized protein n=1 Tax=Candidatus Methanocrinis alkalitolerans TaxID=3033395 RepID=A0ABT5XI27_9EURY|nr:hypothetical protein [Candidatus Methanocrinis alkalitolerans]MDF0594374.1 hypothetical protein [Candidatus Methanocrinis alkalitolerans]